MAANERISVNGCRTPVVIAPGPNISGIASGTKATFSSSLPVVFGTIEVTALDGMKSEKPICIKMMPPTIRTMLSGTSNTFSSNVPKIRKKTTAAWRRCRPSAQPAGGRVCPFPPRA